MLCSLFSSPKDVLGEGNNGLKFAAVWRRAGHNNIKHNPVFRGMPGMKKYPGFNKGKLKL